MDTSPSGTRQPKQARAIRTRERILDQAEHAFATLGFEAASLTSDILDPAGISVGSFYHQFADKRAVLHALLDERREWRDVNAAMSAAAEQQPTFADAVRHAMLVFLDDIDRQPAMWWIHSRELHSADTEIRRLIEQSWSTRIGAVQAVLRSRADDSVTPGRLAFAALGLIGVLAAYLNGDEAIRREMRDVLLDDVVAACVDSFPT